VFPLGGSTKAEVRAEAAARGLAVADKPDSHDICFIADGDTRGFLASRLGTTPGDIVDGRTGAVLGRHAGAYGYTVGQRKGLDLRVPGPDGRPRYVLSITPKTNTVTVGPREDLEVHTVTATRPIWHGTPTPVTCDVQLRAHGEVVAAEVAVDRDGLTARLRTPARGVAAGQAIVAYRPDPAGDIVLGSATIAVDEPAVAGVGSVPGA
jgi:tRNA-specific 2-thiouridylase